MQNPRFKLTDDDGGFLATVDGENATQAVASYCESRDHNVKATRDGLVVTEDDGAGSGAVRTVTALPVHRGSAGIVFVV